MNWQPIFSDTKFLAALIAAGSAIIATLLTNVLNLKKNKAEAEKFKAEAQKLIAEAEKLKAETEKLKEDTAEMVDNAQQEITTSVEYQSSNSQEIILFNQRDSDEFDYKFNQAKCWRNNSAYGERAAGTIEFQDNTINIERLNVHGRLELIIKKYNINGEEKDYIPKNIASNGDRKFHLSFKAKSTNGKHFLRVVAKDRNENKWLAQKITKIDSTSWEMKNAFLRVPCDKDLFLRIDNESPSKDQSNFQLSEIKLAEKI